MFTSGPIPCLKRPSTCDDHSTTPASGDQISRLLGFLLVEFGKFRKKKNTQLAHCWTLWQSVQRFLITNCGSHDVTWNDPKESYAQKGLQFNPSGGTACLIPEKSFQKFSVPDLKLDLMISNRFKVKIHRKIVRSLECVLETPFGVVKKVKQLDNHGAFFRKWRGEWWLVTWTHWTSDHLVTWKFLIQVLPHALVFRDMTVGSFES